MRLGPVIDRWVDPVAHPARNLTLSGPQGRVKIAVRATPLSSCPPDSALSPPCWRFDYALLNADFAAVETSGSPPNLRVVAHRGLGELLLGFDPALPLHVPADAFSDLDQDPGNDWSATRDAAGLRFRAPPGQGLRWGTLYRFSVIADRPLDDDSRHPVALRDELDAPVLAGLLAGPREPSLLFRDGFE
ncbi:MAG: hypothetical protein RML12_06200 [Xanthomonadales bacterium]|nr:hypothetical protein [Xanthomonadales bacterium]